MYASNLLLYKLGMNEIFKISITTDTKHLLECYILLTYIVRFLVGNIRLLVGNIKLLVGYIGLLVGYIRLSWLHQNS